MKSHHNSPLIYLRGVDVIGGRLWLLTYLTLTLTIIGCGGEGSGIDQSPNASSALADEPATYMAVANASPNKSCPSSSSFLASNAISWKVTGTAITPGTTDTADFREDCTFHTYKCGTLGYIISGGENFGDGIVNLMVLGHFFPDVGCLKPGENLCAYHHPGERELTLECQLMTPLAKPFQP